MMLVTLSACLASLLISAQFKLNFDRQRAIDYQWLFSNRQNTGSVS